MNDTELKALLQYPSLLAARYGLPATAVESIQADVRAAFVGNGPARARCEALIDSIQSSSQGRALWAECMEIVE